jgi:hypothetical protein
MLTTGFFLFLTVCGPTGCRDHRFEIDAILSPVACLQAAQPWFEIQPPMRLKHWTCALAVHAI